MKFVRLIRHILLFIVFILQSFSSCSHPHISLRFPCKSYKVLKDVPLSSQTLYKDCSSHFKTDSVYFHTSTNDYIKSPDYTTIFCCRTRPTYRLI